MAVVGQKYQTDVISPSRHTQKSSQHVRACATVDGAICSKNRKIVPYHGDSPNSRISARLRSPSPIMAPVPEAISDVILRADLHDTIRTGLRHELFRVNQTYNSLTTVVYVKKIVVGF